MCNYFFTASSLLMNLFMLSYIFSHISQPIELSSSFFQPQFSRFQMQCQLSSSVYLNPVFFLLPFFFCNIFSVPVTPNNCSHPSGFIVILVVWNDKERKKNLLYSMSLNFQPTSKPVLVSLSLYTFSTCVKISPPPSYSLFSLKFLYTFTSHFFILSLFTNSFPA